MAAKKNSKPGAVKYFNDRKAEAYKSAARAMKEFKKNMPKAQYGESVEERLAIGKQKAAEEKRKRSEEGRAAVYNAIATQPWAAIPRYAAPAGKWSPQEMVAEMNRHKKGGVVKKKSSIKSKKK